MHMYECMYECMYVFMHKAAADEDGNVADILLITLYVGGFWSRGNLQDQKYKVTKSDREVYLLTFPRGGELEEGT